MATTFTFRKRLLNNFSLKVFSLIIAYIWWLLISQSQKIDYKITLPIVYPQQSEQNLSFSTESIEVTLQARRSELQKFLNEKPAIYLNTANNETIIVEEKDLFLPEEFKLVNYKPQSISIIKKT